MIRRPHRSTQSRSSAASDVYKRQEVDVSCRFHPRHDMIGYLHDEIGVNYGELIVKDLIRTTVRKVVGTYKPEELYSTKRDEIEKEIEESLDNYLKEKNVVLQSVFVRSIKLPVVIETAIQDKLKQQQEAEKLSLIHI
eukprot:TRINITY_DN10142_c0_g1_i2.p1 TRINITY_DN10142_c0_g1~~TRINITY_DN10142_c0_g1_i2.p1  ORF type:complete len:138 (-),score=28.50 TRINITY_DN10142_c0_g1_i2:93-506(-)